MSNRVTKYAEDIVSGKIIAGKTLILAAKRHLNDLKIQKTADFPYYFDEKELELFLNYAALVPDPDTGVPQPLMDWQVFILGSLVAWKDPKTKGKRFRRAIVSIARGQGKTYLASILATYDFFIQSLGKSNQDIIVSANTSQQTIKLFNYTKGTAEVMLRTLFKRYRKTIALRGMDIVNVKNKNQIVRMSAEAGKFDGYHASTAIFDEAGDQHNREAFGKITSGMIKNENALFFMISTAYQNPNSPLREDIESVAKVIASGERVLDDYFLGIWSQDDENEVFKPETWMKSNPLLGLPSQHDKLLAGLESEREAKLHEGKINEFLVKNMNIWVNAQQDSAFELEDVKATAIDEFDMTGRKCYIGFDSSMTSDDAALAFVFPYVDENDNQKWFLYQHSFIPWHKAGSIDSKEKQDGINYRQMEQLGFADITLHEKGLINADTIYAWLMQFVAENQLEVLYFAYDYAHAYSMVKAIEEDTEWVMMPVRQGTLSLNEPTKWLQDALVEGRVTHLNDPMMEKSFMNAIIKQDNNGIKIDKDRATAKIDLVDAIIDALYQGIYHFEAYSEYNNANNSFERMNSEQLNDYIKNHEGSLF